MAVKIRMQLVRSGGAQIEKIVGISSAAEVTAN
jgi:hypothetical protein